MVYFVTRPKSREHKLTLEEVLFGLVDDKRLSEVSAPQNKINVNTRTDCIDKIPDKVLKVMQNKIAADIDAMVAFYNRNKELDIFFDSRYNYARQCEIKKQVKNKLILSGEYDEELIIAETKSRMENEGLMYNPYYYTFFIPKHSSEPGHMKFRQIDAPEPQLKGALTELKEMFEDFMGYNTYHTAAYAYVKGRSTVDLVKKLQSNNCRWILKLDFSNFFGSINFDFAMKQLSNIFPFSEYVKSPRGKAALEGCLRLCFLDGRLPQGTPISPLLTNILMIPIDYEITNKLLKNAKDVTDFDKDDWKYEVETLDDLHLIPHPLDGEVCFVKQTGTAMLYHNKKWENRPNYRLIFTRYADDMYIGSHRGFKYKKVIQYIKEVLKKFDAPMKLNEDKTRYSSISGRNWILGLMYNQDQQITIGHRKKKQNQAMLCNFAMDYKNHIPIEIIVVQEIMGNISYMRKIEPEYTEELLKKYNNKFGFDIWEAMISVISKPAA